MTLILKRLVASIAIMTVQATVCPIVFRLQHQLLFPATSWAGRQLLFNQA
jgi:hypothetical protein